LLLFVHQAVGDNVVNGHGHGDEGNSG